LRPLSTEFVSIVDDDPFVRAATKSLVRSLGWEACEFASARAFLASGMAQRTRCLVCDIQMPEMDGIELQDRLRSQGICVPTLFITAYASTRVRERVQGSTALCLIEKPIDARELQAWLDVALRRG
jgi:FixJ family two-component response regulator